MAQYLGLDCSTQSLTALIIDSVSGQVIHQDSVNFGKHLPSYNSPSGFLETEDGVFSNPLMWVDALDLLFSKMHQEGFSFSEIKGISGSGQQHATVYLNDCFQETLETLKASKSLSEQLKTTLSREVSPIWRDNTTGVECQEIEDAVGREYVLKTSGSFAAERFSGPQIRKFAKNDPAKWNNTATVHLNSSFMASIMAGTSAPIDFGDGAGMNLMNLHTCEWDEKLLDATTDSLITKLPKLVPSDSLIGKISSYFVEKYGFDAETDIIPFSGDNPSSLMGCGASLPGRAVISLGTSDTFFGALEKLSDKDNEYGHIFGNPAGNWMSLLCFRNGSLAREWVRDKFNVNWKEFTDILFQENDSSDMILPFVETEITPAKEGGIKLQGSKEFEALQDEIVVKRLVQAQIINMKYHAGEGNYSHIILTGGASIDDGIAQIAADVFQAEISRLDISDSASLGAGMRAAHAVEDISWEQLVNLFCKSSEESFTPSKNSQSEIKRLTDSYSNLLNA